MNTTVRNSRVIRNLSGLLIILVLNISPSCSSKNDDGAESWAKNTLHKLTLEKKVAQLICSDVTGIYVPEDDPRLLNWIKLAHEYGIGGFVLYGGTPQNVAILLNRLQQESEIPLLISADFEGGPGQQVAGATEFPGNMAFAAARDTNLMFESARIMAQEGRAMGIHLTYTPVTDISQFPNNPQESVRSFGGDIDLNGKMLKAYVKGYKESGMLTTAKHFPGRGNMTVFPEFPGFNYLSGSADEIRNHEFKAFQYAVDAGVDFIMTEHLAVPSITQGSNLPASVEAKLTKEIIRNQLGFTGLVTTDDLWYEHVIARFGAEEVAVKALEAGHDIVLKPKDPVATIKAIVEAVKAGRITEEQINNSVYKLLILKARLGLHHNKLADASQIGKIVGTSAHQEMVQKVADRSVTLLRNENILPLKPWNPGTTIHITIQKDNDLPAVPELIKRMSASFKGINNFSLRPGMGEPYYNSIKVAAAKADMVFLSFFTQRDRGGDPAPIREQDLELIRYLIATKPGKVVAMSFGNPHVIGKIGNIPAFLIGYGEGGWYGNQQVYFDSFIRVLKGELIPNGKLPLLVSETYPVGFGLTYQANN